MSIGDGKPKRPNRKYARVKVSVVICTYTLDMYEHFREAADSVLTQTHDDIEFVVIVDGTPAVFDRVSEDYGDRENAVIECNDENVGLLQSRNRGAEVANGDIVAFIDDDAIADEEWIERLVRAYEEEDALAVGGRMTPKWVAGKPSFLPEEFYWLIGVTHRGFADGPGEVRNTFGSNISFRRDIFLKLGGFDINIGGRKGDKNLQGGETELCARLRTELDGSLYYAPCAKVGHKVFEYRTQPRWLLQRAFWQGYSKRAMEVFVPKDGIDEEGDFLRYLLFDSTPRLIRQGVTDMQIGPLLRLFMIYVFTFSVGIGYLYGVTQWR